MKVEAINIGCMKIRKESSGDQNIMPSKGNPHDSDCKEVDLPASQQ